MTGTGGQITHETCDDCGCVYDADKLKCPVCVNRDLIDRIRDKIWGTP